jgi:hypothetical protein
MTVSTLAGTFPAPPFRLRFPKARATSTAMPMIVALIGVFLIIVDSSRLNVALSEIQHSLGADMSGLQWVVDGYTLMLAAAMLSAGVLCDRIGAARAYFWGLGLFAVASAGCARRQLAIVQSQAVIASLAAEHAGRHRRNTLEAETLVGLDAVQHRLEQLAASATSEVLSLVPGGAQTANRLAASRRNDEALLTRGVEVHTVLQDSARTDPGRRPTPGGSSTPAARSVRSPPCPPAWSWSTGRPR